ARRQRPARGRLRPAGGQPLPAVSIPLCVPLMGLTAWMFPAGGAELAALDENPEHQPCLVR
ncbi:MAG: hypothetical protein ACRDRJ_44510, partial [Streptosporangiaceae bacterium]